MRSIAFVQALNVFERTRCETASLDGTEDCRLAIEPDGRAGHAWLSFQVSRVLYAVSPQTGRGRSGHITLAGGFAVGGDSIGQMIRDFAGLFDESKA